MNPYVLLAILPMFLLLSGKQALLPVFLFCCSQCFFQHCSDLFLSALKGTGKKLLPFHAFSIPCKDIIYWLNGLLERTVVYFMWSLMLYNWSLFSFFSLPPICTWENSPSLGPTPCSRKVSCIAGLVLSALYYHKDVFLGHLRFCFRSIYSYGSSHVGIELG